MVKAEGTLILGGGGFLGSNITRALMLNGEVPTILDQTGASLGLLGTTHNMVHFYRGSIRDTDLIEKIIQKNHIVRIIHLVSRMIPSSLEDEFQKELVDIIEPTKRLLSVLELHECRMVFISSGGAIYGNGGHDLFRENDLPHPISWYGRAKLLLEKEVITHSAKSGINHLVIRPSNPYGRFQKSSGVQGFIAVATTRALQGAEITIWGDGQVIRDYLHVDDFVAGLIGLINTHHASGIYNLGSGSGHSLLDVISLLEEITKTNIKIKFTKGRSCDPGVNILDVAKIQRLIPYHPRTLRIGLNDIVNEIRQFNNL